MADGMITREARTMAAILKFFICFSLLLFIFSVGYFSSSFSPSLIPFVISFAATPTDGATFSIPSWATGLIC